MPELLQQKAAHAYVSQSLDKLIVECNKEIDRQAKLNQISTGTTLSLLFAYKNQAVMKHIGDSRIYLERNAEWSQVTRDHTWEQQEISQGRDPKKDPAYNKKRGALVNALGAGITCYIDTQMMQMACGDRYLLCSDGFYHYVEPETDIKTVGESAQQIMEHMAEKIRKTPATDNFTAVLIINGVAKPETFAVNTVCL